MSDSHSPEELQKHVKAYIFVFVMLIIGTLVTVGVSWIHFESVAVTVAIALFIACVKGFLVAGYFMHLISEKKMIYGILAATAFFFTGLMYLIVWSLQPTSLIHLQ